MAGYNIEFTIENLATRALMLGPVMCLEACAKAGPSVRKCVYVGM